jgi:deoxycytidylate deaminase
MAAINSIIATKRTHEKVFSPSSSDNGAREEVKQSEALGNDIECKPCKQAGKRICKRSNVISWDDYFMSVAFLSAMRSKDPSTQVGACIVNEQKRIVGIGYNGFPRGCSDDDLPWDRISENVLETKYPVRKKLFMLPPCSKSCD